MADFDFDLESTISDAANSVGLSPSLLASLLKQESNFNPRAVSSAGAIGIAQFMPATAREMGIDPTDPVQSIYGAAQYLRKNVDMFDGDIAAGLAAYNAGPGRVAAAIKRGGDNWHQLLPSETRDYIPSILGRVGEDDFSVGSSSMPQSRFEPKLEDWADRLGLMGDAAQERQKPAETGRNAFAYANDTAIDIANSAAGMAKAGVDLFDPTSRASQAIGDFIKQGRESQSDWKKQQEANLQQELASADGEWDKAGKYIKHKVANDPLGLAAEVVGNAAPFVFTGGALGALSAGARTAASMGLASGLTAGEVRGNIFEKINGTTDEQLIRESPEYRSLRERMGEKEAKEIVGASIIGNIPELAGAAVVGALGGKYGFEGMMAGVAPRMGGRLASGAIGVADEATQGAVEQLASNIGVRRVLPSQSLTEDIGLNAAAEGILGVGGFARPIRAIGSAKSTDEAIAAADQALTASTAEANASLDAATLDPAIAAYEDLIGQQRQVRDANQQALLGDEEYRPGAVQPASGFANRFPPEPPRALTYHPTAGQLVVFPDGSAMTRTEYEQRKAQQEQSRLDGMIQDAPLPGMMQRAVEQAAPVADAMELNALVRDERADKSARLKAEIERLQAKNKPADVPSAQTATAPSQGEASPIQDSATVPAQTRANSANSPATNALQQQYDAAKAAGDTATMRLLAPQINAEKQRNTQATAERQKPAVAFAIGQTPANAEPITVRNGVVYQGEYALEDYETGKPITVPEGATHAQIRKAMEEAGQVPKGFKFFGEVKAVVQPVAADAPAQTVPVTEVPQTPAVRSIPLGRRKSPIMRRDDLVGAIMRVTGGDGIAANLAQTITGDTANNVTKLRGLFANNGNGDLDDVAMLLRTQEGYDIRDGNHLSDLISEAAAGNMTYSMERTERERASAADAEHREHINARASELGLKKIGGRRNLKMVEADIAREEKRLSDLEAQAEREAIVASEAIDDAIGLDMTEPDWMAWVSDDISGTYTQEDIDRAEENRANRENARAKALAYDYAEGQAQGGSRQGNGDSQAAAEGGGTETGARGAEEGLTLTGQTNAEAAAEFKRKQEEENKQEKAEPAKNVTADQVDLFNTQGGLFNSNREAPKASQVRESESRATLPVSKAAVREITSPESAEVAKLLGNELPKDGKAGIIADIRTLPSAAEATGTRMSRKTAEAIRFIAQMFGRKVVFYEATHNVPEGINHDGKTLYVNVDSGVDALAVAGHEFTHSLQHTDPEAYQAALDAVKGILKSDPARAESYAAYYGKQDMDADALAAELLSDIGGNLWRDEGFFGEMFAEVQRQHPHAEARSIITRLRDALVAFINKLIAATPKQGFQLEEKGLITREELESIKGLIVKMAADAFIAEEKARVSGETMYQPGRVGKVTLSTQRLSDAWQQVAQDPSVFRYPKSDSKDLAEVIDAVLPGATVKQYENILDYEQAWEVLMPKGGKAFVLLFPDGSVELNSKQIGEGNDGSAMYAAVGNWAHNTGHVFNGDRLGIEGPGIDRRIQNLISLALKFQSTDFIGLGKEVEERLGTKLIPGEFRRNLNVLLQESYDHVALNFPEIEDVRYNFDTGRFSPPIDAGMVERAREAGVRGGKGTLAVAAFSNSVLVSGGLPEGWKPGSVSDGDTGRNELAGALYSTQRQTGQDVTDNATPQGGVSLSTARVQTETPEFKRWFGNSKVVDAEGRPLVVYHGTNADFSDFERGRNQFSASQGFYFSPRSDIAKNFARGEGGNVIPVYLSITNPYIAKSYMEVGRLSDEKIAELESQGFDGVYFKPANKADWFQEEYVAFRPEQIKSATGNNGQFDPENPDIRYSTPRVQQGETGKPFTLEVTPQDGQRFRDGVTAADEDDAIRFANFLWPNADVRVLAQKAFVPDLQYSLPRQTQWYYSQLSRAVDNAPEKVFGPAKQVSLWLQSNKAKLGIKDDELQWTGVLDWLATRQRVTKADVLAYLDAYGVQVQEVAKGGTESQVVYREAKEAEDSARIRMDSLTEDLNQLNAANLRWWAFDEFNGDKDATRKIDALRLSEEARQSVRDFGEVMARRAALENEKEFDQPKYSQYVLPGGENYRELLLTLPDARDGADKADSVDQGRYRGVNPKYRSSHWDEANILAHIRYNDRTDADGNKVLFIEELQSDWGQKGREDGFAGERLTHDEMMRLGKLRDIERNAPQKIDAKGWRDEMRALIAKEKNSKSETPSAPFVTDTKAWVALAVKRMIAHAVQNGYDRVAFVTGEQSADRYDLSKQVDSVEWTEWPAAGKDHGILVARKDSEEVIKKTVPSSELESLVGKDVARNLLAAKPDMAGRRTIEGDGLKVGGEGMKTFYDRIVPQVVNDVLKKVGGGKVETVELDQREPGSQEWFEELTDADILKQPGFTITPAMKEKVAGGLPLFSAQRIVGASNRQYTQAQQQAFANTGRTVDEKTTLEKLKAFVAKRWQQGIFDQFAPFRQIDMDAYTLMRLSKGSTGAFEALMHHGKLAIKDGAYDADTSGGVMDRLFYQLGKESTDFLYWVAGNRAERLAKEGKENLFSPQDIAAYKSLANGTADFDYTIQTGPGAGRVTRDRTLIYADAQRVMSEFNKNVLDMAEKSGLIDGDSRKLWEHEFYVPFYRVMEDDEGSVRGANISKGLVRQEAFKKLKGGTEGLNDLLANTLMNWAHLIDASSKNRAASAAIKAAENVGVARPAEHGEKNTVWYMDGGKKVEYKVEDAAVMEAITGLEYAGIRGPIMDILAKPKHWLTIGVTASPFFKVRNLIRDSLQAIGTSDLSKNPIANVVEGMKLTNRQRQEYVSALAGGGLIRFGTMLENNEAARTRQLIKKGAKDGHILDGEPAWRKVYDKWFEPAVAAYNELGNRGEEINRMALYDQLRKKGVDHATASLMARDLMDFSLQGSFQTIRFLSQVVPFFNARLQGMYKLGRATKENREQMAFVIFASALAGLGLMALAAGDEDKWKKWKRREEWDKASYWWFEFGGMEFRIPKPFELGAVAHIAERTVEAMFDNERDVGKRWAQAMLDLGKNQLAMNPVPQAFKPIIDLYANKDSFTGRPIETMAMQRLAPTERYTAATSMPARGLSSAIGGALSPVQIDQLVRSYFGWMGATAVGAADMLTRAVNDEPTRPALDYFKFASGGMVKEDETSSRYVTQMYEQAAELEQAYATYNRMRKEGRLDEAKEYAEDNADKLKAYRSVEAVKKQEKQINERIRMIERSELHPAEKRIKIRELKRKQSEIAERLSRQ